jgi:hypothetical protein
MTKKHYQTEKDFSKNKKEKPVEEGFLMDKVIWKGKPITGRVISLEKTILNFDCVSGAVKYFPGVMLKVQDSEGIKEAGIIGSVDDYKEFLDEEISYLYRKIELKPKTAANYNLHMWDYSLELINNPDKKLKKIPRINL